MYESSDAVAARLSAALPDARAVAQLAEIEPGLSRDGALSAIGALERQVQWLQARQLALIERVARVAPSTVDGLDKDFVREEVAGVLRIAGRTATDRILLAREAARRADTRALLSRGETSLVHLRVLCEETAALTDQVAAAVEADVLDKARTQAVPSFRRSVRRSIVGHQPDAEDLAAAQSRADRFVSATPLQHGMGELRIYAEWAAVAACMAAINGLAGKEGPGHERTADQCRADAAVQLLTTALGSEGLAASQRVKPTVFVTVALSTLIGLDQQPADLDGQPIAPALARHIAADPTSTWRRLVTDDLGHLVDYGRTKYRPPPDLADHVMARDRTCVWIDCNRPAHRTEIDHRQRWVDQGETNADNLQCLCRRHHAAKDEGGWSCRLRPDGTTVWISPTGRRYERPPATYPGDRTGAAA